MIRVFVAVDLSQEARKELARSLDRLAAKRWPVRWEPVEKLHLTLSFLGWVKEDKLEAILGCVENGVQTISPFTIRLGKLGVFPNTLQPRIVWLGIKGDQPALVRLRRLVAENLITAGFSDEKRPWNPHLTIGRMKKESSFRSKKELGRQLQKLELSEFEASTLVDRIVIYRSILKPSGSKYVRLSEIPLNKT
ncbi:MAG: 2'-5' RNA ligase [Candidatus Chisholmbacteria bacterium RIFCSPLOWO2_01_FULL_49_14]|uniref:RNA 2',3'-cyclic phosphodiesterase n=1 Tax=Candidatus Chisholmbacteria bacterium RIFCSPLOWO2_01_FULL_49_14 TaxID=1797593 RepID=A0A1G1W0C0_9BACT|nr:MAG: 2'-5' RNA ligase [Candidatus Chisholmbacteria bacterium RIFCSPLOWO2_01_FULL_49_14]